MSSEAPTAPEAPAAAPRRRRLWPKIVVALLLLVVVLALLLPRLAAPIARSRIESKIESALAVDAELDDLSLAWTGDAGARGLVIADASGELLLSAARLDAEIAPLRALFRDIDARARLQGVEVHLRRDANGRWNVQDLPRERGRRAPPRERRREPTELPDLSVALELRDATVYVHDARAGTFVLGPAEASLVLPDVDSPAQMDFTAAVRTPDGREGRIACKSAFVAARDGRLDLDGAAGSVEVVLEGIPLDAVAIFAELPETIERIAGVAGGTVTVELAAGGERAQSVAAKGRLAVRELDLALAAPSDAADGESAAQPITVREPEVTLDLDAALDASTTDVTITRAALASSALTAELTGRIRNAGALARSADETEGAGEAGTVRPASARLRAGMDGDAETVARADGIRVTGAYVPERVGALLARWLPEQIALTGTDPAPIELAADGPLVLDDVPALLANLTARAEIDVAPLEASGLRAAGTLGAMLRDGRAELSTQLDLNGGRATLVADLGLAAEGGKPSTLSLEIEGARAKSELAPLLAKLHPVLAAAESGSLEGAISLSLALEWPSASLASDLQLGEPIDLAPLSGRGRFTLRKARLSGVPLLDELASLAGRESGAELALAPLAFAIGGGRVAYEEPWTWTIGGARTSFGGSIGFDGALALVWRVPLDDQFVRKQNLPRELVGQMLELPLTGTVQAPRIEWKGALDALVSRVVQEQIETRKDEAVEDVKKELEEKLGDVLGGRIGRGDDPEALLREADELWDAGKRGRARALYERIREEYELSPTYLLNRDRIKERIKD